MLRKLTRPLCALALLTMASPSLADTHIDNVDGISISRDGKVDRFTGMVIDDSGYITELLDFGDRPSRPIEYRVNGKGRVIMPGFVDAHVRLMDLGLSTLVLDLSDTRSLEEGLATIRAYSAAHPDRPWIVGRGWNVERWGLGRYPKAADLDQAEATRPVWILDSDGEAGWANNAALKAAGITAKTPDPALGRLLRFGPDRQPAGVLIGSAREMVERAVPPPLPDDLALALHNAQQLLLARGITAIADMGTSIEDWMAYRRAGDAGRLHMRIMAYADTMPTILLIGGSGPTQWLYEDRLRMGGINLVLDGALATRGSLLKAEYADKAVLGLPELSGTQMRNLISRASLGGFQVAITAHGDEAAADALSAIGELSGDYAGERRWRIEHLGVLDPADIPQFAAHSVIASMQPLHAQSEEPIALERLGEARLASTKGWSGLSAAGANVVFGSYAPAVPADPLAAIALSSQSPGMSREQALAAYTAGAAFAGFAESHFGSLAPGERADFVFLSADPLKVSVEQLPQIEVLETWIAGQRVYAAGQ